MNWISVDDRLPEELELGQYELYSVKLTNGDQKIARWTNLSDVHGFYVTYSSGPITNVTHWLQKGE